MSKSITDNISSAVINKIVSRVLTKSMIELKSEQEKTLNKTLKIEEYLLPTNYNFLLLIYMNFLCPIDGNFDKLLLFINNEDYTLLKRNIINNYNLMNETNKKKLRDFILTINKSDIKKKLRNKLSKSMDIQTLAYLYIYLLKLSHDEVKTNKEFDYDYIDMEFEGTLLPLDTDVYTKTDILRNIDTSLKKIHENDLKDIYYKVLMYEVFNSKKTENIHKIFNKFFIDMELFLSVSKNYLIISYNLMYYDSGIDHHEKAQEIMKLIYPSCSSNEDIDTEYYCKIIPYLVDEKDINDYTLSSFQNFITYFYINLLKYKEDIGLSENEAKIIKNVLDIIVSISKDTEYSPEKYRTEIEYIKINTKSIRFFYYYLLANILDVNFTYHTGKYMEKHFDRYMYKYLLSKLDDRKLFELTYNLELQHNPGNSGELATLSDYEEYRLRPTATRFEYLLRKTTKEEKKSLIFYHVQELYNKAKGNEDSLEEFYRFIFLNLAVPMTDPKNYKL